MPNIEGAIKELEYAKFALGNLDRARVNEIETLADEIYGRVYEAIELLQEG